MNDTVQNIPVTASLVADHQRDNFLPNSFGNSLAVKGESLVYAFMRHLCESYFGGVWNFYTLSNGGFYLCPPCAQNETLKIEVDGNGYCGNMSADAAGIVATLFTLGYMANSERKDEDFPEALVDHYYNLRDYALCHPESRAILSVID